MAKKRGRCPSFISATFGSPKIETALAKRICKRHSSEIIKGEKCVTVRIVGTQGRRVYSFEAMRQIISQTRQDLDALELELTRERKGEGSIS